MKIIRKHKGRENKLLFLSTLRFPFPWLLLTLIIFWIVCWLLMIFEDSRAIVNDSGKSLIFFSFLPKDKSPLSLVCTSILYVVSHRDNVTSVHLHTSTSHVIVWALVSQVKKKSWHGAMDSHTKTHFKSV